jgi:hypothetical protein
MFIHNSDVFSDGMEPQSNNNGSVYHNVHHLRLPYVSGHNIRIQKKERTMLVKTLLWIWYLLGLPAFFACWFNILRIMHLSSFADVMVTTFTLVMGVARGLILYSEKGDKIIAGVRKLLRMKPKKAKSVDDENDFWKDQRP